jgi:hypothetical protein
VPAETRPVETSSAYARAYAALRDGQTAAARDLTDQILGEAVEARDLFPPFITRARDFLLDRGLTTGQLHAEEARLSALLDPAGEAGAMRRPHCSTPPAVPGAPLMTGPATGSTACSMPPPVTWARS